VFRLARATGWTNQRLLLSVAKDPNERSACEYRRLSAKKLFAHIGWNLGIS